LVTRWIDENVIERRTRIDDADDGTKRVKVWPGRAVRRAWTALPTSTIAALYDLAWSRIVRAARGDEGARNDWAVLGRSEADQEAFMSACGPVLEDLSRTRTDPNESLLVRRRHARSVGDGLPWAPPALALTAEAAARLSATCGSEVRTFFTLPLENYIDFLVSEVRSAHVGAEECEILRVRDAEFFEATSNPRLWELTYMQRDFVEGTAPIREVCNDAFAVHIFNERFANEMVEISEEQGDWAAEFDEDPVPTEDIHLHQIGWDRAWHSLMKRHMIPLMRSMYDGTVFNGKSDPFVVRYIMTGQYELEPHQDSSVVTSVVTLSNEFEGGGVTFPRYNCTFISKTLGLALFHPGRVTHQHHGLPISAGRRYIFVSFNKG
jgi:hypothetical protein